MRTLLCCILLAATCGHGAIQTVNDPSAVLGPNAVVVKPGPLNSISNALVTATARASAATPQLIYLLPGWHTNHSRLFFPKYVSMWGAGMDVSYIYTTNNANTPIKPESNESFGNFTVVHTNLTYFGTFGNVSETTRSATNCTVHNVRFKATWLNLHFADDDFSPQFVRYYNCIFESGYDNCSFICDQVGAETNRQEFYHCVFISDPDYPPAAGNGTAINVRLDTTQGSPGAVGYFEHCKFVGKDGTNAVMGIWMQGLTSAQPEAYVTDCTFDLSQTNFVTGGMGTLAVTNDNGVCIFEGAFPTNRIVGGGTYGFRGRPAQASSVNAVATAANTTETDLMSYTVSGGTLASTNQTLLLDAWGSFGATANSKDVRVKLGGQSLLDTLPRPNNAQEWMLSGVIQYVNSTTIKTAFRFEVAGFVTNDISSQTLKGETNIVLRITGSNHVAAASDIVMEGYKVRWAP